MSIFRPAAWVTARLSSVGLRGRLVALVLAIGIPFLATIVVGALMQAEATREHAQTRRLAAARIVASRLDDYVSDLNQLLVTLSVVVSPSLADTEQNDRLLAKIGPNLPAYVNNLVIWDLQGWNIGGLDPRVHGVNVADREYFRAALRTGKPAIEAPIIARTSGEAIAQFARPLVTDKGIEGVVSVSTKLRHLQKVIDAPGDLSPGSLILVLDQKGVLLAHSPDPNFWIGKNLGEEVDIGRMLRQRDGVTETISFDGVSRLTGFSTGTRVPWLVFVGVPSELALAPAQAQVKATLAIGGAMLFLALGMAVWIGNSTARPLKELARVALTYGDGNLAYRAEVGGVGEVRILARTLNRMAARLLERGGALADSERRLRLITDHMPAFIGYIDRDQRFRFANEFYRDVFGADPGKMIGRTVLEVRGAAVYGKIKGPIEEALQGMPVTYEFTHSDPQGDRDFVITYLPDYSPDNQVLGFYVMGLDVTARKHAEGALQQSEARLRAITDNMPVLISVIGPDARYRFCNALYGEWLGVDPASLIGRAIVDVVGADEYAADMPFVTRALSGESVEFERTGKFGNKVRHMLKTYLPMRNEATGEIEGIYAMVQDRTERKSLEDQFARLAQIDDLTGLPNRSLLLDRLQHACAKSERGQGELAVLYLDLDNFKSVNDRWGHSTGDAVLKEFAARLKRVMRSGDTVARMGGDEFVAILEGPGSIEYSETVARKILLALKPPFECATPAISVSTSIGVATSPPAKTWEELLDAADAAMYRAKAGGRAKYALGYLGHEQDSEAA